MPLPIPTTYIYQKGNEVLDGIIPDTSLIPSAVSWSLSDQLNVTFSDVLSVDDKATLDDYMTTKQYDFVGHIP